MRQRNEAKNSPHRLVFILPGKRAMTFAQGLDIPDVGPGLAPAKADPRVGPTTAKVLTLEDAVRVALEKNPTVQAADAYAQAVEEGIAEAKASRAPRIDFSESFLRGNNPVYVFGSLLTERQFTAADFALNRLNTPTPLDNFRTQFAASIPLFDAGQARGRIRDAQLGAESAAHAHSALDTEGG